MLNWSARDRRPLSARLRRWVAAVMGSVLLLASPMVSQPALATPFGSLCESLPEGRHGCISLANNIYHVIRWDGQVGNQIPNLDEAVLWVLDNVYNPTDFVAYRNEGDSLPDVWVHDFDYGYFTGIVGWTDCGSDNTGTSGQHPNRWCRGQHVRFNSWFYTNRWGFFDTAAQSRNVACHELGHTVGLHHNQSSRGTCMWTYAGDGGASTLDSHDRYHVNSYY